MKKVLSWVLAFALVLGTFATSFAANSSAGTDYSDIAGQKCEGAVAVLSALDVVKGYPDGTYKPANIVTRAEMVALVIRALDLSKYAQGTSSNYSDVTSTHWAAAEISYATSMGIIQGYPDGTFRPGDTVTYQEALTMIIRALGYKDEYLTGSWPANFVNQARTLGLLDDIDSIVGGANRGDVAIMLYNALDEVMVTYDTNGNQTILTKDDTMLNRLDAVEDCGIIDMKMVSDAVVDIDEFLGAYCHYWMNDDDEIIVVEGTDSTFLTGDLTIDGKEVTFDTGSKEYTVKSSELAQKFQGSCENLTDIYSEHDAIAIYNGEVDDSITDWAKLFNSADFTTNRDGIVDEEIDDVTVAVQVSGSYITDIYSVICWEATGTYQWDEDMADDLDQDQEISGYGFGEDDNDAIDYSTFFLAGVDKLDNIKADDIVTIYVGKSDITKVEVSNKTVKGEITEIVDKTGSDGESYVAVTINKKDYVQAERNYAVNGMTLSFTDGIAYLNYQGDIAFFDKDSSEWIYGIYMDYAVDNTWEVDADNSFTFKIYTKDGIQKYGVESDFADDINDFKKLDGDYGFESTIFVGDDFYLDYGFDLAKGYIGEPVRFTLDENGDIDSMDWADDVDLATDKEMTSKGVLDGRVVSEDVVVFYEDSDDPSDFDWTNTDYDGLKDQTLTAGGFYSDGTSYATDDGEIVAIFCGYGLEGSNDMFAFYAKDSNVETSATKAYEKATLLTDGAKSTFNTKEITKANGYIFEKDLTPSAAWDYSNKDKATLFYVKLNNDKKISSIEYPSFDLADSTTDSIDAGHVVAYVSSGVGPAASYDVDLDGTPEAAGFEVYSKNSTKKMVCLDANDNDYQFIGNATIYQWKVADEEMVVSKFSEIGTGDVVFLMQTNEDNEEWDVVFFVSKDDVAKLLGASAARIFK